MTDQRGLILDSSTLFSVSDEGDLEIFLSVDKVLFIPDHGLKLPTYVDRSSYGNRGDRSLAAVKEMAIATLKISSPGLVKPSGTCSKVTCE